MIFGGCANNQNDGIEKDVANKIELACKESDDCVIDLKSIAKFDWDKMYVFKYGVTSKDIDKIIGTPAGPYTEFTRKIIFALKGKVVYKEENPSDIESLVNGEVVFEMPDTSTYQAYTSSQAKFIAHKKEFYKGIYYELRLVQ